MKSGVFSIVVVENGVSSSHMLERVLSDIRLILLLRTMRHYLAIQQQHIANQDIFNPHLVKHREVFSHTIKTIQVLPSTKLSRMK